MTPKKAVYTIVERKQNDAFRLVASDKIYIRIGWAKIEDDGSYSIELDALPVNGKLVVRDWSPDATAEVTR